MLCLLAFSYVGNAATVRDDLASQSYGNFE